MSHIPFNRAFTTGRELEFIGEAIAATRLSGNGPFSDRCSDVARRVRRRQRALLTHTATAALEMAFLLAEIERATR